MESKTHKIFLIALFFSLTVCFTSLSTAVMCEAKSFPGAYDSRKVCEIKLKNKHQKIAGPCWAFASIASLETYLAAHNEKDCNLSEKHLLNWAHRGEGESGWNISIKNGGIFNISDAYFTSGNGPVSEYKVPYNTQDTTFDKAKDIVAPSCSVRGIKIVPNDIESIKQAVTDYGAVTVGYYPGCSNVGHAISIVGWNDEREEWLVKDSGYSIDSAYKFLNYSEKLSFCRAFTDVKKYNPNEKIYQYDEFGVDGFLCSENSLTCANVYDFAENEKLDSVMVYSENSGSNIKIYYAPLNNGMPDSRRENWVLVKNSNIPYNGYTTFNLDNKLTLPQGKGSIVVEMTGERPSLGYMPCDLDGKGKVSKQYEKCYIIKYDPISGTQTVSDIQKLNMGVEISALSIKAITVK